MIRFLKKAAVVAMFVGLGSGMGMSADWDVGGPTPKPGSSGIAIPADGAHIFTSDGTVESGWDSNTNLNLGGNNLTIGSADDSSMDSAHLNFTLGTLRSNSGNVNVSIVQSKGSGDTGKGTHVTVSNLNLLGNGGTIANLSIGDSAITGSSTGDTWQNKLTVDNISTGTGVDTKITIGSNSLLSITNSGLTTLKGDATQLEVTLNQGTLQSAGTIKLADAVIQGTGIIDADVILDGTAVNTSITVNGAVEGSTQTYTKNVTVNSGQILVAGNSSGKAQMDVLGTLTFDGTNSSAIIGGTAEGKGILTANKLELSNGSQLNVNPYGRLEAGDTTLDGSTIALVGDSEAVFNGNVDLTNTAFIRATGPDSIVRFNTGLDMGTGSSVVLANGATADFGGIAKGYILNSGSIESSTGANRVAVGSGITVENTGFLNISNGEMHLTQSAVGAMDNTTPGSGNLILKKANGIHLDGAASLYAHTVTVDSSVTSGNLYSVGSAGAKEMYVENLIIEQGASIDDSSNVATTVRSYAQINGEFNVAGSNTTFEGGARITGTLGTTTAGTVDLTLGSSAAAAAIRVDNGTIDASNNDLNIIDGYGTPGASSIVFSGKSTVIGNVDAQDIGLSVRGDLTLDGNSILTGDTYIQSGGKVTNATGSTSTIVATSTNAVRISGSTSSFAVNGDFGGDLIVANGAKLVGSGSTWATANTITNTSGSGDVTIDSSSSIDLSEGSLNIRDYDNVNLAGIMRVGYDGSRITQMNLGSTNLNTSFGKLELDGDLVNEFYNNVATYADDPFTQSTNAFVVGNVNNGIEGGLTVSNVFGDFGIKYSQDGAWFNSYTKTDVTSTSAVRGQLGKQYGDKVISWGLAQNMSQYAQSQVLGAPEVFDYTTSGRLNDAIFEAMAYNQSNWATSDGAFRGVMDHGLIAAYNGQSQAGVNYVAEDASREIISTLHSRLDAYRKVRQDVTPELSSDVALGSLVLNPAECATRYQNRFWAGALKTWQNASRRNGFDGYKYKGKGLILGYDRAIGAAVIGAALSYIEGDYENKVASRHNSEIKHYSADVYATYNFSSGFFGRLMGGYTHSKNDMNEVIGGNTSTEDYYTNTWHASGRIGFDFEPSERLVITPTVGADFFYSRSTGHTRKLSGVNMVHYGTMSHNAVELPVDMNIAYNIELDEKKELQLLANGGYAYNLNDHGVLGDIRASGSGTVYRAIGRKAGHNSWKAGAGAKLKMDNWDLGVKYDYYGRSGYNAHRVTGAIGYNF